MPISPFAGKGKPAERRGRKAADPESVCRCGQPGCHQEAVLWSYVMEDKNGNLVVCPDTDSLSMYALVQILRDYNVDLCRQKVLPNESPVEKQRNLSRCSSGFGPSLPDLLIRVAPSTHSCPSKEECVLVRKGVPVLLISQEWLESEEAVRAAGISGYVGPKCTHAQILEAVKTVIEGGFFYHPGRRDFQAIGHLSSRQVEVMRLVGLGYTDQEIAANLNIGETTVRHHLRVLHQKLRTERRGEIAAIAALGGLCGSWQRGCHQAISKQDSLFAESRRFVA